MGRKSEQREPPITLHLRTGDLISWHIILHIFPIKNNEAITQTCESFASQ